MKRIMLLLAAAAIVVGLGACSGSSGASDSTDPNAEPVSVAKKSFFDDPTSLAQSFADVKDARFADPKDEEYLPGVTVTEKSCILESKDARSFACYFKFSDGDVMSPVIVVNEAGDDWVSHER